MLPSTSCLVFDFGRVLVDLDFNRAFTSWAHDSRIAPNDVKVKFSFDEHYRAHECGEINSHQYFAHLRKTLGIDLSDQQFLIGWNAIFLEPMIGIEKLLASLPPQLALFVFSNTNAVHYAFWRERYCDLLSQFQSVVCSHELGARKPDAQAFLRLASGIGRAPNDIIFFDDVQENVNGANASGLRAYCVQSVTEIRKLLVTECSLSPAFLTEPAMRPIGPMEARRDHSITAVHHQMKPGGELRFRISSSDGTRYIRTERPTAAGGEWQDAHYHNSVQETYIVQRGWIGFAEERDGRVCLQILHEGAVVTTQPLVRHNVYMPAGAVIHTVKHGAGRGEDKEPAPELTAQCTALNSERAILDRAAEPSQPAPPASKLGFEQPIYDDAYRHFDSLIWQMPAWSTAIFLGTAAVLGQTSAGNLAGLLPSFTPQSLAAGFLLVVFSFLLGLTQALYRFRVHQAPMKDYRRTKWWSSASTHLQAYVTAQAFVVLYLALAALGLPLTPSALGCAGSFLLFSIGREFSVRSHQGLGLRRR